MLIELRSKPDFGGSPWPKVPPAFDLKWLESEFVKDQRNRRELVITAVRRANKAIDEARASVTNNPPDVGTALPNGLRVLTGDDQRLRQSLRTHAHRQVVAAIAGIKKQVDETCIGPLKDMERAALTAKVLAERGFDKLSCLNRTSGGMNRRDAMAYRADCATLTANAEPIVLHKMAQNAIDVMASTDDTGEAYILIGAILNANLRLNKDRRAFHNAALLDLVSPPEFAAAQPLLQAVINLRNEAYEQWALLAGHVGQVSLTRMARGLSKMQMPKPGIQQGAN